MDFNAPNSEPEKSFEKPNTEKAEKNDIASKPDDTPKKSKTDYKDKKIEGSSQKPKDKPKNKIEPRKIDPKKEPKHKIQPRKSNPLTPPRNKIAPRKIDIQEEPRHKIQPRKSNPLTPPRNKIKLRQMDVQKEPKHRIQHQQIKTGKPRNKIEPRKLDALQVTKNKIVLPKIESKDKQNFETNKHNIEYTPSKQNIKNDTFNLEKIKEEIKKINWKSNAENWSITIRPNQHAKYSLPLDPTKDVSKENPLYKHKQWLKTVYNNQSWNLTNTKLGKICGVEHGTIAKWRKKFHIPTKFWHANNKLYYDAKSKECGRCHEIKPYTDFTFRRKKDILYPKSTCKKCDGEQKQIFALQNKIKVVENLYNGKLGMKCPECKTGPEKLPALEFHHTIPSLKKMSWHARMYKNWEKTKEILEKEKVQVLCRNCHDKQRTITYKNFGNIITRSKFNLNASTKEIREYIRNDLSKPIKGNDIYSVEHQIKKFTIVNKLYGGKCVGCEQITTQNNLPTFNFHHRDLNQDEGKLWAKIKNHELNQIKNELIEKNCVSLCGNCHQMIHSTNFKTQHEEIIGSEHWGQVKTFFNRLEKNMNNFKFQKENNQKLAIKPKNPQIPPSNLNKKVELVNLEPKNKIEHIPIKESKSIVKPKLNYTSKNKLFNDGKQKECGRCHQIKLHNEFELRIDKRKTKPYLRSNCNQCKNELKQIYLFRNKYKILTNIYNGKYKERCPECETKFIELPTFDFHHPDRSLKEEQRIRTYGNWTKTMEKLEKEKVIPLCKNCHAIKQATTYNKYKEIILKRNDFEKKLEGMEKNIHQYMRTNLKYQKYEEIRQIKPWIKKRIVIERLYNGKCVGCDEDKLPTLQFHHKDPKQKTYEKWSDLSNLNIRKIMKKLKEDNAVCLCANCHSMTESSQFKEDINKIIEKRDIPELKTYYKKINQNIKNYVFPNQPEPPHINFKKQESTKLPEKTHIQKRLSSANLQLTSKKEIETRVEFSVKEVKGNLNYQYGYGEAWKKYLLHISKLLNEGQTVHTKTLAESVGVNTRNTRKCIQKLLNKGLITINGVHNNRAISLTEKGVNESKKNFPYIYM